MPISYHLRPPPCQRSISDFWKASPPPSLSIWFLLATLWREYCSRQEELVAKVCAYDPFTFTLKDLWATSVEHVHAASSGLRLSPFYFIPYSFGFLQHVAPVVVHLANLLGISLTCFSANGFHLMGNVCANEVFLLEVLARTRLKVVDTEGTATILLYVSCQFGFKVALGLLHILGNRRHLAPSFPCRIKWQLHFVLFVHLVKLFHDGSNRGLLSSTYYGIAGNFNTIPKSIIG